VGRAEGRQNRGGKRLYLPEMKREEEEKDGTGPIIFQVLLFR